MHFLSQYDFLFPTYLIDGEFKFELEEKDDINMAEVKIERKRLKNFLEFSKEKKLERRVSRAPKVHYQILYSKFGTKLDDLTESFLTKAVSVASSEESFSQLKLIKNYLRSTMSNHRLTNLAILSIEREYTKSLDVEIIKDFVIRKVRRINT